MKKIISVILILATLLACLSVLPVASFAASRPSDGDKIDTPVSEKVETLIEGYLSQSYYSAQNKIDQDSNMVLMASYANKELYANRYTGEVYIKDTTTGEIMHSNPYDLNGLSKSQYGPTTMSQVILKFDGVDNSIKGGTLESFSSSAKYGQITIDYIVNGIRVNYTLGDAAKRYVLPYSIKANDLIDRVLAPMQKIVAEELYQLALDNKVPEEDAKKYYNFENFYKENAKKYSTLKVLGRDFATGETEGEEFEYGNFTAFEAWFKNAEQKYQTYYRSLTSDYRKENNILAPAMFVNCSREYFLIYNNYIFISPYGEKTEDTKGNNPEAWTKSVHFDIEKYAVLKQPSTHPDPSIDQTKVWYDNALFELGTDKLSTTRLREMEKIFGDYGYTLNKANEDEEKIGIFPPNNEKPIFYVSIEYRLTEDGFTAEIPATSIVYDETKYKIKDISLLPYMGSADVMEDGYFFFPDGSGAIVDFAQFRTQGVEMSGKIYGQDYAKYIIDGMYTKAISMPVFGTVYDRNTYVMATPFTNTDGTQVFAPISFTDYTAKTYDVTYRYDKNTKIFYAVLPYGLEVPTKNYYVIKGEYYEAMTLSADSGSNNYWEKVKTTIREKDFLCLDERVGGYLAIVEEGAALSTIFASFNGESEQRSRIGISFANRVEDVYEFEVKNSTKPLSFTVQSKSKYTGSFKVRYRMLTDEKTAQEKGVESFYEPSYVGMAAAYQDYLISQNLLPTTADIQDQLPLIIESFGVTQTKKKFLSIPFTVDVALTTFDDVETMYKELAGHKDVSIKNIKFRLTGFTNGGMTSTYPVKLKWEGEAGGKRDFKALLKFANSAERKEAGLEIYPNFDFLYVKDTSTFDGINLKKIGARSADNRYAVRKEYSSFYQGYSRDPSNGILVTASKLESLFNKFKKKYNKLDNDALSFVNMASDLSGDFDEDNGITREESLAYITEMLANAQGQYKNLMSDGGNLYALKYMSYLVNAPLDSSHYKRSSRTVPFWGMVVHGHVQYAGSPFNENANKDEALLRAIESGASLYFTLSYDNTDLLKDNLLLNKYYAVNYEISKDTVAAYYKKLNDVIGDLQNHRITNHQLLQVERIDVDAEAHRKAMEEEFMTELAAYIEKEKEDLRFFVLSLKGKDVNENPYFDVQAIINNFDLDKDGKLNDEELNQAYLRGLETATRNMLQTQVVKYQENSYVKALLTTIKLSEFIPENMYSENSAKRQTAQGLAAKAIFSAMVNGLFDISYGQTISTQFDEDAILASAREIIGVDALDAAFEARLKAYMQEIEASNSETSTLVISASKIDYVPAHTYFTTSDFLDEDYRSTESTIANGTVVMVTYSKTNADGSQEDVNIILNYNIYAVNVRINGEIVTLPKCGYMRLS